jgi:hypothetical protein
MNDHDPLCMSRLPYGPGNLCHCGTIRIVRADEAQRLRDRAAMVAITRHIEPGGIDRYTFRWSDPHDLGWAPITQEALASIVDELNANALRAGSAE